MPALPIVPAIQQVKALLLLNLCVLAIILGKSYLPTSSPRLTVLDLVAAFTLTRYLSASLYGISPIDPLPFIAASVLIITVALLGSYLPARRAANLDPVVALRQD